ncbi:tol-pal system protein YbgF [Roseivivax isoporae LMG 25204]|uniref:Cell division coordinator CpoB n=1 Tax=Roseivivax isoporae LMG 25204 TaxID=1449351 RepID=X7FBU5_9RHOB|nr:tol-pal system protein YbgF [Roseivivax isoporae LMG 25204]
MRFAASLTLAALVAAGPVTAQDDATLADIRQDISSLAFEVQRLKRELSTTGQGGVQVAGSVIDRVNAIEAELTRLTSRTEEMQNRVDRVVQDGTNRIGDLKFRLCELEEGCDIGALGTEDPLGGTAPQTGGAALPAEVPTDGSATVADIETGGSDGGSATGEAPLPLADSGTQLAAAEEQDYRRAQEALASGDFQRAADLFASFRETYPGGPLDAAALLGQGHALDGLGQPREAARAYLDVYSGSPDSPSAPEALWRLGAKLGELGSVREACVTLAEVPNRYPGTDAVARAAEERAKYSCQ